LGSVDIDEHFYQKYGEKYLYTITLIMCGNNGDYEVIQIKSYQIHDNAMWIREKFKKKFSKLEFLLVYIRVKLLYAFYHTLHFRLNTITQNCPGTALGESGKRQTHE